MEIFKSILAAVTAIFVSVGSSSSGAPALPAGPISQSILYYQGSAAVINTSGNSPSYASPSDDIKILDIPAGTKSIVVKAYGAGSPGANGRPREAGAVKKVTLAMALMATR